MAQWQARRLDLLEALVLRRRVGGEVTRRDRGRAQLREVVRMPPTNRVPRATAPSSAQEHVSIADKLISEASSHPWDSVSNASNASTREAHFSCGVRTSDKSTNTSWTRLVMRRGFSRTLG